MHGGVTGAGVRRRRTRWRSRLRPADLIAVGTYGLRGRKGRAALTAIGIAIGIAAIVSVFGISASSRADVLAQIDELGTDLLVVRAGSDVFGGDAHLPLESTAMVRRVGPVDAAASVSRLDTEVHRNRYMTTQNGLDVLVAEPGLLDTLDGTLATGRWVDARLGELPVVVLGAVAAQRLGIVDLDEGPVVSIAGVEFAVIGIVDSLPLHPDLDRSVFVGAEAAERFLGAEVIPTRIYLRADPDQIESVRGGARPHGQPGRTQRGRRLAAVRCARSTGPRRREPAPAAARAGRGRARRGWRRRRQRDGHLGARTAVGDRPAPRARGHPSSCGGPVRRRVGDAHDMRRSARGRDRLTRDDLVRPPTGLAAWTSRPTCWRWRSRPRWHWVSSPACTPPPAPPASTPPTQSDPCRKEDEAVRRERTARRHEVVPDASRGDTRDRRGKRSDEAKRREEEAQQAGVNVSVRPRGRRARHDADDEPAIVLVSLVGP